MNRVISVDYETPYSKEFTVNDLGYWKYARDPRCVPYMVSVCDGSEVWAGHPRDFNFDALAGATLLSHHAVFDQEITLGAVERGLFPFPKEFFNGHRVKNWHCTLNMSAFLWNVRSLADASRVGLGVTVNKATRDKAKGKSWEDMVREGWAEEMLQYARDDAQRCWELWNRHGHRWPQLERDLSQLTIDQGRRGVAIDVPALEQAIQHLQRVIVTAQNNLPWTERGRKPASPLGIAEECRIAGIPNPPVKAHDPEAAAEWEETYAPRFRWVMALRNIRKAKKTLATLETIQLRLRPDGTVAFSLKYAGAHTLRWAGDSGWNLQNQNKEPLFIDESWSFVFDKKLTSGLADEFDKTVAGTAAVGSLPSGKTFVDMRGLIVARPGFTLGPTDLSQIEPRVVNWLAGNHELLRMIEQGLAIYEAHARATMGYQDPEPLKTANKKLYALAKARCVGVNTPILTPSGYIPIQSVTDKTQLHTPNGIQTSDGAVCTGVREYQDLLGEAYTGDHLVFLSPGETRQAGELREGMRVAEKFRRDCSGDSWSEIWRLVRYLAYLAKDTVHAAVSPLFVRKVWAGIRGRLAKHADRSFQAVPSVRHKTCPRDQAVADLGEDSR